MGFSGLPWISTFLQRLKSQKRLNIPQKFLTALKEFRNKPAYQKRASYISAAAIDLACIVLVIAIFLQPVQGLLSPLLSPLNPISASKKGQYEVFGFAPYWTIDRLNNVDFDVLSTLAYFDIPIKQNGELDRESRGYKTFTSPAATQLFQKAHRANTRVVATFTQMDNSQIKSFLNDPNAQARAIIEASEEVKSRGIDGANIDFELVGDPGSVYRDKFSSFVAEFTQMMHREVPSSRVTVSVYAASARDPKLYDISSLARVSDGVFMMAYDFATTGARYAQPTAPLYGYKDGVYWYDVSSAVDDFLSLMPSNKLVLGVPWYGYNYAVYTPEINAETHKGYYVYSYTLTKKGKKKLVRSFVKPQSQVQTYSLAEEKIKADLPGMEQFKTGWDEAGKVGYRAYYSQKDKAWRMIFIEDTKSLGIKYDFVKEKGLGGVGMWALGFDEGKDEFWTLLASKFGSKKLAQNE